MFVLRARELKTFRSRIHPTFTAALLTIGERGKQPAWSSTDEWINKMRFIHIIKYCSVLKRKEILIHAPSWVTD